MEVEIILMYGTHHGDSGRTDCRSETVTGNFLSLKMGLSIHLLGTCPLFMKNPPK